MTRTIPCPPVIPRPALALAIDEATALGDLVWLVFLAGEGMAGHHGAAIARAAVLTVERVRTLQTALDEIEAAVEAALDAADNGADIHGGSG